MYHTRPITTRHQIRPSLQYAAPSDVIPESTRNWSERWCTIPKCFEREVKDVLNFEVRADDVFVVTFPKCGTTWMQEIAWLLTHDLDYESASKTGVLDRSVYLEFSGLYENMASSVVKCNKLPSPRVIKSHLPPNLLPTQLWEKKTKLIYVARNLKDVIVSFYHFLLGLSEFKGKLEEFVEDFMNDELQYCPYLEHIVDYWNLRHEPYIFFVTFEEMKHNLPEVLKRLCTFLERPELNEKELQKLVDHLSFDKMKTNPQTNRMEELKGILGERMGDEFRFMRRGIVGAYKDELPVDIQQKLDAWSHAYFSKYDLKEEDIFGILENPY